MNTKKFWNFLHFVKGRHHPIPLLKQNDIIVSDDPDKATTFNKYFFIIEDCNISNVRQPLEYHPDLVDFSVEKVHSELLNLQQGKTCGPDHIPAYLLQKGTDFLASLTKMFQLSLSTGTLPKEWVTANIVPVYKKGDRHLPSNYHPISLTSIVVKVMERIVHHQVLKIIILLVTLNMVFDINTILLHFC